MNKYFVYLMKCSDGKYYIGQTENIERRVNMHNSGYVKSTKSRLPVCLVGYEEYSSRNEARWREHNLKKSAWKRSMFIKNMENTKE